MTHVRKFPNVLVTGTPGTGKTTMCEVVAERTGVKHVNVGDLVKSQQLHEGWDPKAEAYIVDEDKVRRIASLPLDVLLRYQEGLTGSMLCQVVDALEEVLEEGGVLVDYHSCDFFPER